MTGSALPPAEWLTDRTGRFPSRYWDGTQFTRWVTTVSGDVIEDPLPGDESAPASAQLDDASSDTSSDHNNGGVAPNARRVDPEENSWQSGQVPTEVQGGATTEQETSIASGSHGRDDSQFVQDGVPASTIEPEETSVGSRVHAGDAVLGFVNKVTLGSWANRRMAEAFWLPPLLQIVKDRPNDPRALLWLGLRLQDMERTRKRIDNSIVRFPTSYITRPIIRAAATAISSGDGRPASEKVLARAWELLLPKVTAEDVTGSDLCLMARVYLAGNMPAKAWEVAASAVQLEPARSEARYVLAETYAECNDPQAAIDWARQAVEAGCTLGWALFQPDGLARRAAYMSSTGSFRGVTSATFWEAMRGYYWHASPDQLRFYFGPSPDRGCVRGNDSERLL